MKSLKTIFCVLLIFSSMQAVAQDEILDFLQAAPEDAELLTENYVNPLFRGFGYGLNNAWYSTAATHKTLGFNLSIGGTIAFVPDSDEFFTFRNSDYSTVRLTNQSESQAQSPTIFGPDTFGPAVDILDPNSGSVIQTLDLPPGAGLEDEVGFSGVPVPVLQLDVGVIKNTDIMVRFVPELNAGDDGKFQYWGVGVKHDIKQWIPGMQYLPFHMSLLLGYTSVDASADFSGTLPGADQEGVYDVSTFTTQVLVSKRISVITFYGGVGFNTIKSNFDLLGDYDVDDNGSIDLTDPISIEVKDNNMSATLGFRLKLAFFTIHGDYTFSEYNSASAGIGFSIRENKSTKDTVGN